MSIMGKKLFSIVAFMFMSNLSTLFAESTAFEFGRLNFSVSTKILKDGFITDMGVGYRYGDKTGSSLRLRYSTISKNEEWEDVEDSLNASNEKIFDVFLLPIQYYFIRLPEHQLWLGGGAYYKFDKLNEKGFFNMPILETLTPPRERVNSFENEFKMHLTGPLLDFGYSFKKTLFSLTFSGGIVPLFLLHSGQTMSITPLFDPPAADNLQNVIGSPYLFFSLDCVLLKYFNIAGQYEFARLSYKVIDFDSNLNRILPEQETITHSIKLEASLLLPLSGTLIFQIGYGYLHDLIGFNSDADIVQNRRHYIFLAPKSR
jgi:hypothetical protein